MKLQCLETESCRRDEIRSRVNGLITHPSNFDLNQMENRTQNRALNHPTVKPPNVWDIGDGMNVDI